MSNARISVVIATLNEQDFVAALLESIDLQTLGRESIEILVVDGLSDDDTSGEIRRWADRRDWALRSAGCGFAPQTVTLLSNPQRKTPAAFNIGVEAARSEFVVIVGAHSVLDTEFLERTVEALVEGTADVVGGVMTVAAHDQRHAGLAVAQTSILATGGADYRHAPPEPRSVDTVPFPGFRKRLWEDIGGFDEELLRNQDDDFVLRARQNGARILLHPDIRFTYFVRPSLAKLWKQYFQYGEYRIHTIYKRRGLHSLRPLAPLALILFFAVLPALLWTPLARVVPLTVAGYVAALSLESARLTRPGSPRAFLQCLAGIAVMQLAYGVGEAVGDSAPAGKHPRTEVDVASSPAGGGWLRCSPDTHERRTSDREDRMPIPAGLRR